MHVSNVLGTLNPVAQIAAAAHAVGALVVVDASQSEQDEACVVSAAFEHVRWRITAREVYGGSMPGAETVRDSAPRTMTNDTRCLHTGLRLRSRPRTRAMSQGLVLRARQAPKCVPVPPCTAVYGCSMLVAPAANGTRRCRFWQEHWRIEASAAHVSS